MSLKTLHRSALGALCLSLLSPLAQAATAVTEVAYFTPIEQGGPSATLVRWLGRQQATVHTADARHAGTVQVNGNERVITLTSPITSSTWLPPSNDCAQDQQAEHTVRQLVYRREAGTAAKGQTRLIEVGEDVITQGCLPGQALPFGQDRQGGVLLQHLDLRQRPAMTDLQPGVALAGPALGDFNISSGVPWPAADLVTLQADGTLDVAGQTTPAAWRLGSDGWLQITDATGRSRAHTRVQLDARSGAELWLSTDLAGSEPQRAWAWVGVKAQPGASFGSVRSMARLWESGLATNTRLPFFIALNADGSGERISKDLDAGSEFRQPIRWRLDGNSLIAERSSPVYQRTRTWLPLAQAGKVRFVMESEDQLLLRDGSRAVFIPRRVTPYINRGSVPPAP